MTDERLDGLALLGVAAAADAVSALAGVRFDAPLETSWYLLDPALLQHDLWRSLFDLHSQPPLFNAAVGLALRLGPERGPVALHALWMAAGAASLLAVRALARDLGASRAVAFAGATLLAVSPAFLLYQHHLAPDLPTAAALVGAALLLSRSPGRPWALTGALALVTVAIGLRSLIVPLFLPLAACAALRDSPHRRVLAAAAVPLLLVGALVAKNAALAGVVGTSSWVGMNFARLTVERLPPALRRREVAAGALSPASLLPAFSSAEEYLAVPGLAPAPRGDPALDAPRKRSGAVNYNHLVFARASRWLLADSAHAVRAFPKVVLGALGEAWLTFLRPSSQYGWLARNRMALGRWLTLWERGLCIELPLPVLLWGQAEVFLALLAGVPAIFAFAVERAVGEPRGSGRAGAFAFAVLMFAGTALVGNTGEVGENNRFRFLVTPLAAAVAAAGAERLRARFRSTR